MPHWLLATLPLALLACRGDSDPLRLDRSSGPAIDIDCARLLAPIDVAEMCGRQVSLETDPREGSGSGARCMRIAESDDGRRLRLVVSAHSHAESARRAARGAGSEQVELERDRESVAAHTRKGNLVATLRSEQPPGEAGLCDERQLADLALVIATRLP